MKVKVKSLSRLFATPWTVDYQAPLSMGFSRQGYQSGLPYLVVLNIHNGGAMVHCMLVARLYLTFCDPMDCSPSGSSVHGIFQARILEWVAIPFSGQSS